MTSDVQLMATAGSHTSDVSEQAVESEPANQNLDHPNLQLTHQRSPRFHNVLWALKNQPLLFDPYKPSSYGLKCVKERQLKCRKWNPGTLPTVKLSVFPVKRGEM